MTKWRLKWTSERSVFVSDSESSFSPHIPNQLAGWITSQLQGIVATIPTQCGVLIEFDVHQCQAEDQWANVVKSIESFDRERSLKASSGSLPEREIQIPVCYDESLAPDLIHVANHLSLHPKKVIELHKSVPYSVCAIGFMPGFGYMKGLHESLRLPRMKTPRTRIPAGSVAIAEDMTAVYPHQSAGGWHLIGRAPVQLFNPQREEPSVLCVGDTVRFEQITLEEYNSYSCSEQWGD